MIMPVGLLNDREFMLADEFTRYVYLTLSLLQGDDQGLISPSGEPIPEDEIRRRLGIRGVEANKFSVALAWLEAKGAITRAENTPLAVHTDRFGWGNLPPSARPLATRERVARSRSRAASTPTPSAPSPNGGGGPEALGTHAPAPSEAATRPGGGPGGPGPRDELKFIPDDLG